MVQVSRRFSSDLRELSDMRALVRSACRDAWGISADDRRLDQLELALQEAATNIIRHAYKNDTEQAIDLDLDADAQRVELSLFHEGQGFDPSQASRPVFDGSRLGGWGMYMIQQSVDRVEYLRDSAGRHGIRMTKKKDLDQPQLPKVIDLKGPSEGTYRLDATYAENYRLGPRYAGPFPEIPATPWKTFLGRRVRSRLGISAGLLLNSKWIACYARLGFDILTYKTVRSAARPCYELPNWVVVDADRGLPADTDVPLLARNGGRTIERSPGDLSWAVCFGMPSMPPDVWREDVELAARSLGAGQLLNVSVVGTPQPDGGLEELAADFARCAVWARDSGADLVEANLSCPNVCTAEGQLYTDPEAASLVAREIRRRLGPTTPLLLKAGHFDHQRQLRDFLRAVDPHVDAIVLVNAVQRPVQNADGKPVFGQFERVGVLGRAIHPLCVATCRQAVDIVRSEGLHVEVCGVGGVGSPEDAKHYFDVGAHGVFMGSAPMLQPHLAIQMKARYPEF